MDTDVMMIVKTVAGFVIRHPKHPHASPAGSKELHIARRAGYWPAGVLYQPEGQGMLHQGLSAFICVHPVKKMLFNN